ALCATSSAIISTSTASATAIPGILAASTNEPASSITMLAARLRSAWFGHRLRVAASASTGRAPTVSADSDSDSARDFVFALYQPAGVAPRGNVAKLDIARQGPEQSNSVPDQHWHAGDRQPVDAAFAEKPLNRVSTVQINVLNAFG